MMRMRIIGDHDNEKQRLFSLLRQLEENEQQRFAKYQLMMNSTVKYHHYASGDVDYTRLNEDQIDQKCYELFSMNPV